MHPDPIVASNWFEVFLLNPLFGLIGMPSFRPSPEGLKNGMTSFGKCDLADDMTMIVCPSPNDRIKHPNQLSRRDLLIRLEHSSKFWQESLYALARRFDNQLPIVLPESLTEKVKSCFDMGDSGLLRLPCIALRIYVRTLIEGSVYTVTKAIKLIPPLSHPVL